MHLRSIPSKEMMLNIDLDSSDQEKPPSITQNSSSKTIISGSGRLQNSANIVSGMMQPSIFNHEQEEDYHYAIIPCELIQIADTRKIDNKEQTEEDQLIHIHRTPSIHFVEETQQEVDQPQITLKDKIQRKQTEKHEETQKDIPQTFVPTISTSIKNHLLNFAFEESSSDSDSDIQQSEHETIEERTQRIKKLLTLKPYQLTPVKLVELAFSHDPQQNMKICANREVEMGKILHSNIFRDESGFNTLWPKFSLMFESTKMLFAEKMVSCTTSNFYITLEKGIDDTHHENFIAKLRGNFKGNIYQVFTRGANPKKASKKQKVREIQATIVFKPQQSHFEPRQFQVYALALNHKYRDLAGITPGEEVGLDVLFKVQTNKGKIFHFANRRPIYSKAVDGYILNFGGRVQQPSVKNFILEDSIAHREVLMLGKNNTDLFRVDISWPLKPLVAFAVCLANFDSKYTCE